MSANAESLGQGSDGDGDLDGHLALAGRGNGVPFLQQLLFGSGAGAAEPLFFLSAQDDPFFVFAALAFGGAFGTFLMAFVASDHAARNFLLAALLVSAFVFLFLRRDTGDNDGFLIGEEILNLDLPALAHLEVFRQMSNGFLHRLLNRLRLFFLGGFEVLQGRRWSKADPGRPRSAFTPGRTWRAALGTVGEISGSAGLRRTQRRPGRT